MKLLIFMSLLLTGCSSIIQGDLQEVRPKQEWCVIDNADTLRTQIIANDTAKSIITVQLENGKVTKYKYSDK